MEPVATRAPDLVRTLARRPWPERCRLVARTARALAGTADLVRLVEELRAGDWYTRQLALALAEGAGDAVLVAVQLHDGTPGDQLRVAAAAVRVGVADDVLVDLVARGSTRLRRVVVRQARRHGRPSLSEALLSATRERSGERDAARLLSGCSAEVLRTALPELGYAVASWTAIAQHHPGLFLDHVEATVPTLPEPRRRTVAGRYAGGLHAAARTDPERVTALLESLPADTDFAPLGATLAGLARRDPERVADLLDRPGATGRLPRRRPLWEALLPLPDARLGRLAATLAPRDRPRFLRAVTPPRRPAVLAAMTGHPDHDLTLVDLLPHDARVAAARRALTRREVSTDPETRRAVTARLPFAEAEPALRSATRDPVAAVRAEGYRLLVGAAAATRDPDLLAAVLDSFTRLPQEQDPVRSVAVRALASVPAQRWADRCGPVLVRVVEDAVRAPDVSFETRRAARDLAAGLLRAGARDRAVLAAAGVDALTALTRTDPHGMRLWGLTDGLPRGAEARLWPAFAERVAAEARVGDHATATALAASLGRRAWTLDPLQQALGEACQARDDATVRTAVPLWLGPPDTRGERVAVLLRRDRTLATVRPVAEIVARHRTDLLESMLRGAAGGRFVGRGVRVLPGVGRWWRRWTAAQLDTFAAAAAELARDTRGTAPARASGLREIRGLPGRLDVLAALVDDPEPWVAVAALRSVAAADDPARAAALLLTHLDSDRAREATPGLRAVLALLPAADLAAPLATMLAARKVTVRKEAVRLVVRLRPPGAVGVLRAAWDDPAGHRDVRRAIAAVLPDLLDEPAAWALLDAAVADPTVADAVLGTGEDAVAPRHRAGFARRVAAVASSGSDDTARLGLDALSTWARFDPDSIAVLVDGVADLDHSARWRPAAHALVHSATEVGDLGAVHDVVARLLPHVAGTDLDDERDAAADRDRPARRRLEVLTRDLGPTGRTAGARDRLAPVVDALAAEPRTADLAVQLAVTTCVTASGLDLAPTGALCTTAGLRRTGHDALLARVRARTRPHATDLAVAAGAAAGSTAEAWLALAVVAVVGPDGGWPAPWREVLRTLRRHPDPDLAAAAAVVVTAAE